MTGQRRQVPAAALRFRAAWELAAPDDPSGPENDTEARFRMVARTGNPIVHPYWGRIVHDLAGMRRTSDRIPVDWQHDPNQTLGYADGLTLVDGDLHAEGLIASVRPDDRAAEIIRRARMGQPYQASITHDFDLRLEELPEGATAEVNGRTIAGPATIVREWTLRAIAVCACGADPYTSTEFSRQPQHEVFITMAKPTKNEAKQLAQPEDDERPEDEREEEEAPAEEEPVVEDAPSDEPPADEPPADEEPAADEPPAEDEPDPEDDEEDDEEDREEVTLSGRTYAVPAPVARRLAKLRRQNARLTARLTALSHTGQPTPAQFQPERAGNFDAAKYQTLTRRVNPAVAAFAASLKLPTT